MKRILLTQDKFTIVDDEDFQELNKYKWHCTHYGYAARRDYQNGGKMVYMHRVLNSAKKGELTDHINQNKLDNRKENLRIANKSINAHNSKEDIRNTSGKKGVYFNKAAKKWQSYITINGKYLYLGIFSDLARAINVRKEREISCV